MCLRSEINSCHRRDRDDPQITINLGTVLCILYTVPCTVLYNITGKCPSGTLYHRSSLTQSLQCLGSWQAGGNIFLVTVGAVWEYWEPGEYRNTDSKFSCMALTTDGLNIYMAEVILHLTTSHHIITDLPSLCRVSAPGVTGSAWP